MIWRRTESIKNCLYIFLKSTTVTKKKMLHFFSFRFPPHGGCNVIDGFEVDVVAATSMDVDDVVSFCGGGGRDSSVCPTSGGVVIVTSSMGVAVFNAD